MSQTGLTEKELLQRVYWEDLFALMQEQQDSWSGLHKMYKRLEFQGGAPELLQIVSVAISHMSEAFKLMESIETCFEQQPRDPSPTNGTMAPNNIRPSGPFRY